MQDRAQRNQVHMVENDLLPRSMLQGRPRSPSQKRFASRRDQELSRLHRVSCYGLMKGAALASPSLRIGPGRLRAYIIARILARCCIGVWPRSVRWCERVETLS